MRILKKFLSSFILLLIGGLIIKTQILFGDGCKGMPDTLYSVFLSLIYLLILLFTLGISTINYFRSREPFDYYPLLTTLVVFMVIILITQEEKFENSTILYATSGERHSLMLCKNKTFKIKIQYVEGACFYKGKYQINNDTLSLTRNDIQIRTDSMFADIYLINDNKNLLYPLDKPNYLQDTGRWLTIELPLSRILQQ